MLQNETGLLKVGSKGPAVARVQEILNVSPPPAAIPLTADGIFGAKTQARVMEVQRHFQIPADGIVGPQTLGKIAMTLGGMEDLYQDIRKMMLYDLRVHPTAISYFDREWVKHRNAIIPIGNPGVGIIIIGAAVCILFAIMMLALMQTPGYQNISREWAIRMQKELDDLRENLHLMSPLDAAKRIKSMAESFVQDMLAKKRRCEEETAKRKANGEPISDCSELEKEIRVQVVAISNRVFQLGDPASWGRYGGQMGITRELVLAFGKLFAALIAWGECMQCPALSTM